MKITKENINGITLIALVITIIILLILAGVSIAMLTGNNGILIQAQNAKKEIGEKSELEKIQIAVEGLLINKSLNETNLKKELSNSGFEIKENENFFKNDNSYLFFGKNPYQIGLDGKIKTEDLDYNFFEISKVNECRNSHQESGRAYGYIEDNMLVSVMGSYAWATY